MLEKIFLEQEQLGRGGRPIVIKKLCTTVQDTGRDPLVTLFCGILMRCGVDKIPQIKNWLRGELALFGIKPMSAHEWESFPSEFKERALKYKPALLEAKSEEREAVDTNEFAEGAGRYLREAEDLTKWFRSFPISIDPENITQRIVSTVYLVRFLHAIVFKGVRGQ